MPLLLQFGISNDGSGQKAPAAAAEIVLAFAAVTVGQ